MEFFLASCSRFRFLSDSISKMASLRSLRKSCKDDMMSIGSTDP